MKNKSWLYIFLAYFAIALTSEAHSVACGRTGRVLMEFFCQEEFNS